ncbi:MAG TPA: PAS domain S-box protein [Deltaproteobacteria bacterium]|nr:PAS domain S-box protein [Deltaproteobacteria bacterium]
MRRKGSQKTVHMTPGGTPADGLTLAQVVDFLPDPALAIDLQGRVIVWNRGMEELTGIPAREMIGKGDYAYALPFYGTRRPILVDLALVNGLDVEKRYSNIRREGDALMAEASATMHGRWIHLWGKASPVFDASGAVVGAIESIRDITDKKLMEEGLRASEAKVRDIFENVSDFLYVHDLDGNFIESNLAYKDFYGYSRDDLESLRVFDIVHEEDRPLFQKFLSRILARGTDEGILRLRTRDGGTRFVEYRDSLVRDEDGRPSHVRGSARDVTGRVLAEQALRESELRYRLLAENIRDVIWVLDLDLRYVYISPSVKRLRGFTVEEAMAQPLKDTLFPESYERVARELAVELEKERNGWRHDPYRSMTIELQMRHKYGTSVWVEATASFLRDAEGGITHLLGVTRDITARKEAEDSLRRSEKRFRSLFESSADASLLIEGSRFVDCNQAALEILGFREKRQVLDMHPGELSPKHQPDGRRSDEKSVEMISLALEKGSHRFEWMHLRADGTVFPTEVVLTAIHKGDRKLVYTTWRDITARKEAEDSLRRSEERFRSLFEDSPDANMLVEGNRIIDCNRAAVTLLRAGSKEEILGRCPWDISPELQPDGLPSGEKAAEIAKDIEEKGSFRFEWMGSTLDGRPLPLEVTATTLPEAASRVVFATCRDITERRKAEEERRVYEARLARSQKLEAIGTLAGGIAHDFNNILSAIIGYTELALDDIEKGSTTEQRLAEVLKGGDRARDLVSQILTFCRQVQAEKRVVKVEVILKEALKLLRSSIPSTIGIVQMIAPDVPAVFADPTQVHQVIMNLCTNAYQAMMEKGGVLKVSLESREVDEAFAREHPPLSPGTCAVLTVEDTGEGMDQETMSRIFEPFFTTREKTRGTGLGLSTVHGIVETLSGAVVVASRLGHGSTFSVFLPAHADGLRELPVIREGVPSGNGERILMVDDETAILELTKSMLEPMGYAVTSTSSSRKALEIFTKDPAAFDLVITDQTMPLLTGMSLASRLLSIRPDLPVILVTGFNEAVSRESALQNGIRVFLDKPFTRRALASAIHEALKPRTC